MAHDDQASERYRLSERVKAWVIRIFYRLLSILPLHVVQWLGERIGDILYCHSRSAQTTKANIALCFPELTAIEQAALVKASLRATGQTIVETGVCWNWSLEHCARLIRQVDGEAMFAERVADPRGLILLMPHLSTWEMLHPVLSRHTAFTAMYKPPKIRPLDDWMQRVRNRTSAVMVPANRKGVLELMKALKEGKTVVVLPDQEPARESGAFAPFFGVDALTITLVHGLAVKTNAQLLLVNATRLPKSAGFDVQFVDANSVNVADQRQSLTAMNRLIEQAVRAAPEQYQWEYKRFKRRPDGSKANFY